MITTSRGSIFWLIFFCVAWGFACGAMMGFFLGAR